MKKRKKLFAGMLSSVILCGVFAVVQPETTEAAMPKAVYFDETFSTPETFDETWKSNSNTNLATWESKVADGKLTIPSDNSTQVYLMAGTNEVGALTDYAVSCKLQFSGIPTNASGTNISLVTRAESAANKGYEFQITVKKDGTVAAGLRDRTNNMYFEQNVPVDGFVCTNENELRIEIENTTVRCYVNRMQVISYDVSTTYKDGTVVADENIYRSGAPGIRMASLAAGTDVAFDDFQVYCINENKFFDDFDGYSGDPVDKLNALKANDWYVADDVNAGLLTGRTYTIPADNERSFIVLQTENAKGALGWNDYSVEADVTIGEGTLLSDVYVGVTGRHVVRGGNDGYEVRLYMEKDGKKQLQIYGRNAGSILTACDIDILQGVPYNLKVVFQQNNIYAYVDNTLYLTASNAQYPIGYAGIRKIGASCGVDVTFDNFAVYDYDVTPPTYTDDFDSYIPEKEPVGDGENYKYSYLRANGWGNRSTATLRTYAGYADKGVFKVPAGAEAVNMTLMYSETAAGWKNCTLEWDLTFNTNEEVAGAATNTYVACRETSGDTGYGLLIGTNVSGQVRYIRIVRNGTAVSSKDLEVGDRIPCGTTVTGRLVLNERTITGYIVGYEATTTVTYTIPETEELTSGYAGIHTGKTSFDVTFDNFTVYDNDNPYVKEIVGDITGDTLVNAEDTDALRSNLLMGSLDDPAYDVNKSGTADIRDLVRIKRLVYSFEH